jgi:cytidine deaminase
MPDTAKIVQALRGLLANAHAPYSGVQVAAAVEGPDGRLYYGVNVENAAYPQGVCAEASAISAAVTAGETTIVRVWLASSLPGLVWPCGGCRQKIYEFAAEGCEVVTTSPDDEQARHPIEHLLPLAFRLAPGEGHRGKGT